MIAGLARQLPQALALGAQHNGDGRRDVEFFDRLACLAVQPDADGLMMRSRGKIPFATTMLVGNPLIGTAFFMFVSF